PVGATPAPRHAESLAQSNSVTQAESSTWAIIHGLGGRVDGRPDRRYGSAGPHGGGMLFVAPDILAEVARMSGGAVGLGFGCGLLLWTGGWMKGTFWFSLFACVGFGLYGLYLGRVSGTHPLVTGLLLGLSAGILSMELGRLVAFVSGGLVVAVAMQTF